MQRIPLKRAINRLELAYGRPRSPRIANPWHLILCENVVDMADDDRRRQAFLELKETVGLEPAAILKAPLTALLSVTGYGILPEKRVEVLRRCAEIAIEAFDADLRPILAWPLPKARNALKRFPGIGEPGAEKILLFSKTYPIFALDSNGLRVLIRLGFGTEGNSYSRTYRSVQADVETERPDDMVWLIRAHLLLRRHGQELCRRSSPDCKACPLSTECPFGLSRVNQMS